MTASVAASAAWVAFGSVFISVSVSGSVFFSTCEIETVVGGVVSFAEELFPGDLMLPVAADIP